MISKIIVKHIWSCKFALKGPTNKHELKFAIMSKSQFRQVHVSVKFVLYTGIKSCVQYFHMS